MNMTLTPSGNLKQFRRNFLSAVALLLITGPSLAEDAPVGSDVPIELIRLRQQFQSKVDQEMAPWREKYAKELQKLEDRLIQERKLKEALAVKAERENEEAISTKPATGAAGIGQKVPESPTDAKKALAGTVWLVYAVEDEKHETLMDVYHFVDSNSVLVFTARKSFPWSLKSPTEPVIQFQSGDIRISVNYQKSTAVANLSGKEYNLLLAGRPELKGN
jgi:hypothetical protein